MKILITGITGFLGAYLARKFLAIGEIHGLKRPNSDFRLLGDLVDQIHWIEGDVTDIISLEEAFDGKDLIIHAAGLVSFKASDDKKLMKINLEGTTNVVNVMLEKGIKKLIHISSVAALGKNPDLDILDEAYKWTTSPLNTSYAISKYLGELEVWRAAQEGLEVIVVLPSVLLGKISDKGRSTGLYEHVLKGGKYFPAGNINFLDVRDAAELIFLLYKKSVWGKRFILNHQALSYKSFFGKMSEVFGKNAPDKKITPTILRVLLAGMWLSKTLGFSENEVNTKTLMLAQMIVYMDNQKVQNLLQYQYTPLEETFAWALANEKR
jgi:nucleoside-diphosphate-sugar epimerase